MLTLITAVMEAAGTTAAPERDPIILVFVLVGVGALVLFAYVASKLMGNPDPEISEEYPLPLDDFDED